MNQNLNVLALTKFDIFRLVLSHLKLPNYSVQFYPQATVKTYDSSYIIILSQTPNIFTHGHSLYLLTLNTSKLTLLTVKMSLSDYFNCDHT